MPEPGARNDPVRNFNFLVEVDGIAQASFMECSGLETATEVIEMRQGGDGAVQKLPGKTTFADITLKSGLTASAELWKWREEVVRGNVQRKNGSIVVFDLQNNTEVMRWNFVNAWPTKWTGPPLDARGSDVAVETLVLAVEEVARG
jgi:phage tail-like protein